MWHGGGTCFTIRHTVRRGSSHNICNCRHYCLASAASAAEMILTVRDERRQSRGRPEFVGRKSKKPSTYPALGSSHPFLSHVDLVSGEESPSRTKQLRVQRGIDVPRGANLSILVRATVPLKTFLVLSIHGNYIVHRKTSVQ